MQKVPHVTLHRSSLSNCARIIKENLNETTPGAGDNLPRLDPYHRSVGNYFHALGAVMGLDLGSPQFYRNDINLALEQVREAMPEGPDIPDETKNNKEITNSNNMKMNYTNNK